jgi:cytochrome oxidase assembly protein ShyY1
MQRFTVRGQYDHSKEMRVAPRTSDGQNGYFLLTPLLLEDGYSSASICYYYVV